MSQYEGNTPKKIIRTYSSPENTIQKSKYNKYNRQQKNEEYKMSDELLKIKMEYEMLEKRNQEELEMIQQQFTKNTGPDYKEFQSFLKKGSGYSRETIKNFQILINNEFTGCIESERDLEREIRESKREQQKLDFLLTSKIEEISLMKENFLTFTETYIIENKKLAEKERKTKQERDYLLKKLDKSEMESKIQSNLVRELELHNQDIKSKLEQVNKEIVRTIKMLVFKSETEKKRYLGNLKKLIELFQIEKLRIEEIFSNINTDITLEKNQHFQDVEKLKGIIDQLRDEISKVQQDKTMFYVKSQNSAATQITNLNSESQIRLIQKMDEHQKYSHELEIIVKNLGSDNQNLEIENAEMKKLYEDKLRQIKEDADANQLKLQEELDMFKYKFNNLEDIKAENEFFIAENSALKTNLNNIDEKYVRRIRVLNAENNEKNRMLYVEMEKQNETIEKLTGEQSDLKKEITNLEKKLEDKNNEIKNMKMYRENLEGQKRELEKNLEKSRDLIQETIIEHEEHIKQLNNIHDTELKKLKAEIVRLQKESKDFQTGMIEQETLYKILKVDFDEFVLEKNELAVKFDKEKELMNEEFEKKINELNGQIAELQTINLNYEEIEHDLHEQIQSLVHNINQLNSDNDTEMERLRSDIKNQIARELEEMQKYKKELEKQIKSNEKESNRLKTELQLKAQKCNNLEEELKTLRISHQDLSEVLEDSKERYEDEIEQLKISNERILRRNKDEITKLLAEFEEQSTFCAHLEKRKKELERLNKTYTDNLEHVTKVYERELKDIQNDLQNTKTYYENKISQSKTEAIFETKKYENRIKELEQELKMTKCEVEWLQQAQRE